MNLTDTPFIMDNVNSLVAVGCNAKVSLTHIKPNMLGCELICNTNKDPPSYNVPFLDKTGCSNNSLSYKYDVCTENTPEETARHGDRCCHVRLPNEPQQVIGIRMKSNDDGNSTTPTKREEHCRVAFITDEDYTVSNATKLQQLFGKGYATLTLAWATTEEKGYTGNAYTSDGCHDVDECKILPNPCGERNICVNTQGHYHCVVDKKKAIFIGFGVLVLVGGLWWLRKVLIKRRITARKKKFFKRNGGILLQQELNTEEGNVEKTRIFSSSELEKATENFSLNRVLGHGGQGTVYKGMLLNGTVGYVDPEYYRSSQYTEKSDVYSFGVVLAELISGDKPVIMVQNTQEIVSLEDHFRLAMKENRLSDIVDARIKDDCKPEQVMAVANLALKCLSWKGKKRPNMRQVFTELERICTSPEGLQMQTRIDEEGEGEEDEEEDRDMINRGVSWSISVTAPAVSTVASPSSSDVEPLFPCLSW
ncbi:hypothetical protein IGI04_013577 [Brassica rapa subsp. trilocularis]|uniref:Protein kinase domain-containing protein n=1 Tax=Brassica rapa subsp. trilocularis TaxID=1813537 RepID=A0ABQ7N9X1_BRACM|nr:hypothetical protein IGI04_013577 [Brassica rapa subsp. trilocularis]